MAVPNIFGTATAAIPLSQLDTNFATPVTIGNTAVQLGNTVTSFGNVTLTNVTISSGNVTITGANVSGTANVTTLAVTGEATVGANVTASAFTSTSTFGFKNRIINGAMVIDQRNAGASVSITGANNFSVDRFRFAFTQNAKLTAQQNAGSVTPPAGYKNYLGITSSSAYTVVGSDYFLVGQPIEGFNTADFGFGAAGASTVTLSFWVRSSLTGTFGGAINNSAYDRSYPFSYTISVANTWEQKTITIAGDTSGTWIGATNGVGLYLWLNLGTTKTTTANAWAAGEFYAPTGATSVVGTNGATFYLTGVQLEKGSTATSFDYRPYGTELALCYRYYRKYYGSNGGYTAFGSGISVSAVSITRWGFMLDVPMRATPTPSFNVAVGYNGVVGGNITVGTNFSSTNYVDADLTTSGLTATTGLAGKVLVAGTTGFLELTGAEL